MSSGEKMVSTIAEKQPSQEAPPAYSNLNNSVNEDRVSTFRCGFEAVASNLDLYFIPNGPMSSDEVTCTLMLSEQILSDTEALATLLLEQAKLPPRPMMRITGTHINQENRNVIDFDLCLDMSSLFIGDMHHMTMPLRGTRDPSGEIDEAREVLRLTIRDFQESKRVRKALLLERKVTNWNTDYLFNKTLSLVRSTRYRGRIEISFPNLYSRVILQNRPKEYTLPPPLPPQGAKSLRFRLSRCFHRDRPQTGKHELYFFEAIRTIWPYSSGPPEEWGSRAVKQTEREWFGMWSGVIRNAVLRQRATWITERHYMSYMAGLDRASEAMGGWGYSYS